MPRNPKIPGSLDCGFYILKPKGLSDAETRAGTLYVIREELNTTFFDPDQQRKIIYPAYRYAGGGRYFSPEEVDDLEKKLRDNLYEIHLLKNPF